MRIGTQAGAFHCIIQLLAQWLELRFIRVARNVRPSSPAHTNAGEGFGNKEAIPGVERPGMLGLEVKTANGRTCDLREFNGAHFCLVDGPARAIGGEDCCIAFFNDAFEAEQALSGTARTGTADCAVVEFQKNTRDEFTVEAAADEDVRERMAKVHGAGQYALVPEAVDLRAGFLAEEHRCDALFCDDFKAPGAAYDPEQRPDDARDKEERDPLAEGEGSSGSRSHSDDFSGASFRRIYMCDFEQ